MADMATDSNDKEFVTAIAENEELLFNRVDLALAKIEDGTYGICDNCGIVIAEARLEAVPYAAFCIQCQETEEKEARRPQPRREDGRAFAELETPVD